MRYLFLTTAFLISLSCAGQLVNTYQPDAIFQVAPRGTLTAFPAAPLEKINNVYLYSDWILSEIYFKDSTKLSDLSTKFSLKNNEIEILNKKDDIRVLPVSKVLSLILKKNSSETEEYINGSLLGQRSVFRDQLLQLVHNGKVSLFCKTNAIIIKGSDDPNPMLGGQTADRVDLKKNYIIVRGKDIVMIDGSKSKFRSDITQVFGATAEDLAKKVNIKSEVDLIKLVMELEKLPQ